MPWSVEYATPTEPSGAVAGLKTTPALLAAIRDSTAGNPVDAPHATGDGPPGWAIGVGAPGWKATGGRPTVQFDSALAWAGTNGASAQSTAMATSIRARPTPGMFHI